jgi:hypothetical protein
MPTVAPSLFAISLVVIACASPPSPPPPSAAPPPGLVPGEPLAEADSPAEGAPEEGAPGEAAPAEAAPPEPPAPPPGGRIGVAELQKLAPTSGRFEIAGRLSWRSTCPPCPPSAKCKPCPIPRVIVEDGGGKVFVFDRKSELGRVPLDARVRIEVEADDRGRLFLVPGTLAVE